MNEKLKKVNLLLAEYGQEHLIRFISKLSPLEVEKLLDEILNIDFNLISSLYKNLVQKCSIDTNEHKITPMISSEWEGFDNEEKAKFNKIGMKALQEGKAAAVLVAGGQGTRLGHKGPKGTFSIGLPSDKSLFQLQCEKLLNLSERVGRNIPWYIMTSYENHNDTVTFFKNNNYFGYPSEDIFFFNQDLLPVIDDQGKILLEDKGKISMGPNGNGGCFLALEKSGALDDMKKRGVEWVFLYGVDNALVKVVDPNFIGFTIESKLPAASKVVKKTHPDEKVGVFCYKDGHPAIVEYTELSEELRYKVDSKGELVYCNANIISHIFHIDVLKNNSTCKLPYHVAHKKIKSMDDHGKYVHPDTPNAYKFELFMFDIFSLMDDMASLTVRRNEEFAPVKNKDGTDSPVTARNLILDLHKQWLLDEGISWKLLENKLIEISPLISYDGENIDKSKVEAVISHESDIILK